MTKHGGDEPTEAQVEAAAKIIRRASLETTADPGDFWSDCYEEEREVWRNAARAALVAAQGAAPQAGAYGHCCNHPKCPGGSLCCCASEQRLRDCWNQWREEVAGDTKQAFRDAYSAGRNDPAPWAVAPVLPSSGVDEDALARLLCEKNYVSPDGKPTCAACRDKAHEVAAWLKVQGL